MKNLEKTLEHRGEKNHRTRKDVILGVLAMLFTVSLAIAGIAFKNQLTDTGTITRFGLAGVCLVAFIAGSAFSVTALPVPYWILTISLPTLLTSRYGIWSPVWVGLLSGVGAALGQFVTFLIGYGSRSISEKVAQHFNPRMYEKAAEWAQKRGSWAVFLMSLLINPVHLPMTLAIAALKYPPLKFLAYSFLGVAIKSLVLAFAGYFGLNSLLVWLGNFHTNSGMILLLILLFISVLFAGFCIWQLMIWISEIRDKNHKYRAAEAIAEKTGKHLLVIGGPWGVKPYRRWIHKPAHGSGDVVLDIDRRALAGQKCAIVGSVTNLPFSNKAFGAVFLSHVLEHLADVDSAKQAVEELNRVADAVFIAYPSRQSIGGWLIRGHHIWVWQEGTLTCLKQRGKTRNREKIVVETANNIA